MNHFSFTENPLSSAKSDFYVTEWGREELWVLGARLQWKRLLKSLNFSISGCTSFFSLCPLFQVTGFVSFHSQLFCSENFHLSQPVLLNLQFCYRTLRRRGFNFSIFGALDSYKIYKSAVKKDNHFCTIDPLSITEGYAVSQFFKQKDRF